MQGVIHSGGAPPRDVTNSGICQHVTFTTFVPYLLSEGRVISRIRQPSPSIHINSRWAYFGSARMACPTPTLGITRPDVAMENCSDARDLTGKKLAEIEAMFQT